MINNVFKLLTVEYSLILATKQEHFWAVKQIRHDVISHHYPEVKSHNAYIFSQDDQQSFIYLLQHNQTKRYVGSVRIFFANNKTPSSTIPMEKELSIENIDKQTKNLPICEISRFALIQDQVPHKDFSQLELRTYLSLALMCATRINFLLYDYIKMFAIVEHSLHRILKRQGVLFTSIGEPIDFHGKRYPLVINKEDLENAIRNTEDTMGKLTLFHLKELCTNKESILNFIENNPYIEVSDIELDSICELFKNHGDDITLPMILDKRFPKKRETS